MRECLWFKCARDSPQPVCMNSTECRGLWLGRAGRRSCLPIVPVCAGPRGQSYAMCNISQSPPSRQKETQRIRSCNGATAFRECHTVIKSSLWKQFNHTPSYASPTGKKEGSFQLQLKQIERVKDQKHNKRHKPLQSQETLRCNSHHYACHVVWQGVNG